MLRPDLSDYGDAYIVVKRRITVKGDKDHAYQKSITHLSITQTMLRGS